MAAQQDNTPKDDAAHIAQIICRVIYGDTVHAGMPWMAEAATEILQNYARKPQKVSDPMVHDSDCGLFNGPAFPPSECNCRLSDKNDPRLSVNP